MTQPAYFTIQSLAAYFGCSGAHIENLIKAGELVAHDHSMKAAKRRKFMIHVDDVKDFEERRRVRPKVETCQENEPPTNTGFGKTRPMVSGMSQPAPVGKLDAYQLGLRDSMKQKDLKRSS